MITFITLLFKTIVNKKDIYLVIETKLLKKTKPNYNGLSMGKLRICL